MMVNNKKNRNGEERMIRQIEKKQAMEQVERRKNGIKAEDFCALRFLLSDLHKYCSKNVRHYVEL
jgi:hypothetical protein